jgi:23S rRNA (pseudouridine1915-N3)-methyltransferase
MNIKVVMIGKTNESFIKEGVLLFQSRLKHYCKFEWIEIAIKKGIGTDEQILAAEALQILKFIDKSDFLALLDETGKEFTSVKFSGWIEKHMASSSGNLIFVIGGAYGFHNSIYERANLKIALSQLTFTHQMVRLIFIEQLYRAFTIIKNEKYHH